MLPLTWTPCRFSWLLPVLVLCLCLLGHSLAGQGCVASQTVNGQNASGAGTGIVFAEGNPEDVEEYVLVDPVDEDAPGSETPTTPGNKNNPAGSGLVGSTTGEAFYTVRITRAVTLHFGSYLLDKWDHGVHAGGPRSLPPGPSNGFGFFDSELQRIEVDSLVTWSKSEPQSFFPWSPASGGRVRYPPVGLPVGAQAYYLDAPANARDDPTNAPFRVHLEWKEEGGVTSVARFFITKRDRSVLEFEGYDGTVPKDMKWRLIRHFKGDYNTPLWQMTYQYDPNHGGLISKTDVRGVTTSFEWQNLAGIGERIVKVSTSAPWSPAVGTWADLDVVMQYTPVTSPQTIPAGLLPRIIWPSTSVTQDDDVDGTLDAPRALQRSKYFEYDSSGRLIEIYEDVDGYSSSAPQAGLRRLAKFGYQTGNNPSWRVAEQHVGISPLNYKYTFAYGTDPTYGDYTEQTDPNGNTDTTYWEAGSDPTTGHLPGNRKITRIVKKDGTSVRPSGFSRDSEQVWTFKYSSCDCGALQEMVRPDGVKFEYTRDSEGRGLPISCKVTGTGNPAPVKYWYWEWESWDHPDAAIASRLKKLTDPRGHITEYAHSIQGSGVQTIVSEGMSSGSMATVLTMQEDAQERVVWTEEASISVDGGGSSPLRQEFTYEASSTNPGYRMLKTATRKNGASGLTTTIQYVGLGYTQEIVDPAGKKTSMVYDRFGRVTSISRSDPFSPSGLIEVGRFEYDRNGLMTVAKRHALDKSGQAYAKEWVEKQWIYGILNQLKRVKEDRGSLASSSPSWYETRLAYDKIGNLVSAKQEGKASETKYEWDGYGDLYRVQRKLNATQWQVTRYGWGSDGFLKAIKNSDNQTILQDPDSFGRLMRRTLPDGQKFTYEYDLGDRLKYVKHYTNTTQHTTATYSYNDTYNRLSSILTAITGQSGGRSVTLSYNGTNRVSQVLDQDGRKISTFYDGYGRVVRKSDDLLATGSGNMVQLTLDAHGLPTKVVRTEQEDQGNASYTAKTFQVEYGRDSWGRVTQIQDFGETTGGVPGAPLTTTTRALNSLSHLVELVGPPTQSSQTDTKKTEWKYDAVGRVLEKILHPRSGTASNITLTSAYNDTPGTSSPYGLIVTRQDGRGNTSTYTYDLGGRLVERKLPGASAGSRTWAYSYDLEGRLLQWVDGNGATVKLGYDSLMRVDKRYLSSMGAQALSILCTNETFAYDTMSRPDQAKTFWNLWGDSQGPNPQASLLVQVDQTLDALGRQTNESFGFGDNGAHAPIVLKNFASSWTYGTNQEDFGFRRGLTSANGFSLAFTPDSIGRPSQTSLSGNGLSNLGLVEYRYVGSRPVNRIHRMWSGSNRFETKYSYSAQRFLSQIETKYGTGTGSDPTIFSQTLVRDLVGKITEDHQPLADGSVGNQYAYDPFDRLEKADLGVSTFGPNPTVARSVQYALDDAQNRTSVVETVGTNTTTQTYPVAANSNQYDSVDGRAYTYDGNGNLISDGYYYYVYDYLDRLSEVYVITYPAGATTSSSSSRTAIYGNEIQKKRAGKPTKLSKARANRLLATIRARVRKELARLESERKTTKKSQDLKISSTVNQGLTQTLDDSALEFVAMYGYDSYNRRVYKVSLYETSWYGYDGWRLMDEYDRWLQRHGQLLRRQRHRRAPGPLPLRRHRLAQLRLRPGPTRQHHPRPRRPGRHGRALRI